MGGNSTKATSGINGAGTQTQQMNGIPDNSQIFFEDTKKSVRNITFDFAQRSVLTFHYRPVNSRAMI
jgi:succinate dehydrogenase/fumarate reductase flavoprotein subunit